MRLPPPLTDQTDDAAIRLLTDYFAVARDGQARFTGAYFDTWPNNAPNQFVADDLVAVSTLSVSVDPRAAHQLLVSEREALRAMLRAVGDDRDLGLLDEPLNRGGPEWALYTKLLQLPGVGPTTASKLFARKRPRLRPIYDSVIAKVTGCGDSYWEPLRAALAAESSALHHRLERLRVEAGLGPEVTALRVFDVVTWMHGTNPATLRA